ncbi:dihydrolipoamide acetyltransferase family protein [Solimicrobium silvestre]|uniref:Dihydrolipoamide acetyltransferase component of pyruvate dehydrogenase complex n=1 Tax=Solimicrobium silvestre TaxID=2099400 RepID=A0A2S9GYT4_9BURK|nr:dihydrolipoamide acetyltransferase family protein [Solimicrobium silvestre]PRC92887.1 Pyruvate/2-oxoglutarate dehydrogenase complex dihydrolipoamide acyltransferase (E2) component [Solimicrobium silvestre]
MGIHVIKMPDIGEGIAEVEVVVWRVQPGDVVVEDQILADVMTDKATIEIPSSVAGTVLTLGGKAGEFMAVGAELIRIEIEGKGNVRENAPALPAAVAVAEKVEKTAAAPLAAVAPMAAAASQPAPANKPGKVQSISVARPAGEKPIASPAVRRRAWDLGVELQFVHGSAAGGRIQQQDLDDFVARGPQQAAGSVGARYHQLHTEEAVPVIGLRRKIAQKMQDAKRRIPHFTYVEEIDMTELEALRVNLNNKWGKERGRLTILPFLMRAMVLALRDFPQINARFDDEAGIVTRFGAVHIGIATQTDNGLIVPVVRHAESLDFWASAAEVTRQAEGARSGKAAREDLSGSTITLTSLGTLGGIVSTPVINHPEVAIVGVNRMVLRPVIRGGAVVARQMMNLSSSFDHRVIDGMHAAEFIQAIRGFLECPAMLFTE